MQRVSGTRARVALAVYLVCVFTASALTDWRFLGGLLAVVLALFFRDAAAVVKRTLVLVAPFVLVASAAAAGYWWWANEMAGRVETIVAFALRAFVLACMTFVFVRRADLFDALTFSKTLSRVLTVSVAQIQLHRRLLDEFPHVLKSRTTAKPGAGGTLRAAAVVSGSLLGLSIAQGRETADAMRSRGL